MTKSQIIKFLKANRGEVICPVSNKNDTFYIAVKRGDFIDQICPPEMSNDEETGFKLELNDPIIGEDDFFIIVHAVP